MPRLIVIKGADEGKQFELDGAQTRVGREAGNDIRLHDTEVSRRHAEFRLADGGCVVADLSSVNGTFVNGRRVPEAVLASGDQIQVGQTVLVYSTGTGEGAADDLADQVNLVSRYDLELSGAIVKSIADSEGSRLLSRPDEAGTAWLRNALGSLRAMYEASQAVSHILDVDQLLERIMDLIFRSVPADRGCVMLREDESGVLEPKAVRWRAGVDSMEKIAVSRTIMEHVLNHRQGVLVSDAARDDRFSSGQSIVRYGIREVICVPMKGRHETLGVIYLDNHTDPRRLLNAAEPGLLTEDHLALAVAIGHQAALAVEDTRYHHAMLQAERLAAIGQTIAGLSHHIKNILQGLRSGSDVLKMGLAEHDEQLLQKGWALVERNQAKIYDLVMDMLSYSKEREPLVEDTDLNRVVRDVLELVSGRAREEGVALEVRLDETLPHVQADPDGLHRAILNVVGNALDAVEERKRPQVAVATAQDPEDGWVRVLVIDNGIGISPEKLGDIFRPFVSSKGAKGTGLGLAVSRKILREHGGDILVQSQLGKLTRFILRLPVRSPLAGEGSTRADIPTVPGPPDGE